MKSHENKEHASASTLALMAEINGIIAVGNNEKSEALKDLVIEKIIKYTGGNLNNRESLEVNKTEVIYSNADLKKILEAVDDAIKLRENQLEQKNDADIAIRKLKEIKEKINGKYGRVTAYLPSLNDNKVKPDNAISLINSSESHTDFVNKMKLYYLILDENQRNKLYRSHIEKIKSPEEYFNFVKALLNKSGAVKNHFFDIYLDNAVSKREFSKITDLLGYLASSNDNEKIEMYALLMRKSKNIEEKIKLEINSAAKDISTKFSDIYDLNTNITNKAYLEYRSKIAMGISKKFEYKSIQNDPIKNLKKLYESAKADPNLLDHFIETLEKHKSKLRFEEYRPVLDAMISRDRSQTASQGKFQIGAKTKEEFIDAIKRELIITVDILVQFTKDKNSAHIEKINLLREQLSNPNLNLADMIELLAATHDEIMKNSLQAKGINLSQGSQTAWNLREVIKNSVDWMNQISDGEEIKLNLSSNHSLLSEDNITNIRKINKYEKNESQLDALLVNKLEIKLLGLTNEMSSWSNKKTLIQTAYKNFNHADHPTLDSKLLFLIEQYKELIRNHNQQKCLSLFKSKSETGAKLLAIINKTIDEMNKPPMNRGIQNLEIDNNQVLKNADEIKSTLNSTKPTPKSP